LLLSESSSSMTGDCVASTRCTLTAIVPF
jgi:hypothetical protein